MRTYLLGWIIVSLLLLPFAGGALAHTQSAQPTGLSAAEVTAISEAETPHCAAMARLQQPTTAAEPQPPANDEHLCCADEAACDWLCAVDCGHCQVAGAASVALLSAQHWNVLTPACLQVANPKSFYLLLSDKRIRPPIIA